MIYAVLLISAYLLGSIPFGWLLARVFGKVDIRSVGSGGTGATNAARVAGMPGFVATWVLDVAKAVAAVLPGARFVSPEFGALCGFVAVLGHCFPVWLRFRGGKGNASMFGVLLAVNPLMFVVVGIEWLLVAVTTRYSSLGAIVGFIVMPLLGFAMNSRIGLVFMAIAALSLFRHGDNIKRLLSGAEPKMQMKPGKLVPALVFIGLALAAVMVYVNA